MKKFRFPLASLLRYRQLQLDQHQSILRQTQAEHARSREQRAQLAGVAWGGEQRIRSMAVVPVEELTALDALRRYTAKETQRLLAVERELEARIELQRQAVLAAHRLVEGLDHLRERKMTAWRAESDRETEAAVGELVTSRFKSPAET